MKPGWYFTLLVLVIVAMIAINELGYGVFALFLLFPAYWLMTKAFEDVKPL
jgi:hypothetical protein